MRVATWIGVVVAGLTLAGSARAQGTGRSLDIQPGARENGMGAAGVALGGDPSSATWWNPAALGFAEWYSGQWTRARLVPGLSDDVLHNFFSVAIPVVARLGVGASYTRLTFGPFQGKEWSAAFSAGYRVLPTLSFGMTAKRIKIQLAPTPFGVAETWGFDVGGLFRTSTKSGATLSAGFNYQNFGPDVTFLAEDFASPLSENLKIGGAATMPFPVGSEGLDVGGTVVADYNTSQVTSEFKTWHGGVEVYGAYLNWARVMLRAGYYYYGLGDIQDPTWGLGTRIVGLTVDVAWIPQARNSDLDHVRKLTVGLNSDALVSLLGAR